LLLLHAGSDFQWWLLGSNLYGSKKKLNISSDLTAIVPQL